MTDLITSENLNVVKEIAKSRVTKLLSNAKMPAKDEYAIAWLDKTAVIFVTSPKLQIDGVWQTVGNETRHNFQNLESDKERLAEIVPEPYLSAILAVWEENENE